MEFKDVSDVTIKLIDKRDPQNQAGGLDRPVDG